jgi:internalin A
MKLSLVVVATTIFTLTLGFYTLKVITETTKTPKTFTEWCEQKANLPQETRHTVEVLLKVAETQNCSQANQTLINFTKLELPLNKISDTAPLSALTNLNALYLSENQISNIKPLSALTNLNALYLAENQISNIKPLSNLTNLIILDLSENQISNIKPLSNLTKLTTLSLSQNQINDIKPLSNLTNLTSLDLAKNPLTSKQCPLQPESICKF